MADTTQTYRPGLPPAGGLHLERYLGVAGVLAAIVAVVAVSGSGETLWHYTVKVLETIYMLATVVAS